MELLLAVLFAGVCGVVAYTKGRNIGGWVIGGLLTGIVSLAVLSTRPKLEDAQKGDGWAIFWGHVIGFVLVGIVVALVAAG